MQKAVVVALLSLEQLSAVSFWRAGSGDDCLNPPFAAQGEGTLSLVARAELGPPVRRINRINRGQTGRFWLFFRAVRPTHPFAAFDER